MAAVTTGRLGGRSLRLIAADLYGQAAVAEEWSRDGWIVVRRGDLTSIDTVTC